MNCYYCSDMCYYLCGWHQCILCNVLFDINNQNTLHIKWERDIGNVKWALNIYPSLYKTVLSGYFPDKPHHYDEIIINEILSVNKDNIIQKIKTVLLFQ